jgi:cysteinyl-tRNA synthetase
MDDDFNTPLAISALFEAVRAVNGELASGAASSAALDRTSGFFRATAGEVLAIVPEDAGAATGGPGAGPFIDLLIETRTRLKQRKDFESGDWIRSRLRELGVELKDSKEGTSWSSS